LTKEEIELIKAESDEAESIQRLTAKQLDLIYEREWFHLLVPLKIGGAEMPLPDFALFMEKLAQIDGSFAWNVNLGAGANMFAGFLDPATAKKLFSSKKTCVAGSGAVGGTAKKVEGGYVVQGNW